MPEFHPVLPLILVSVLMLVTGVKLRRILALLGPLGALVWLLLLPEDTRWSITLLDHEWVMVEMSRISRFFAVGFALFGLVGGLYAWTQHRLSQKLWQAQLLIGGIGVTVAGDWLSLFLSWELLTISSMFLVWHGRNRECANAGFRYALFHIAGGMCFLAGALWLEQAGQPYIDDIALNNLGAWLLLIGMLVNVAAFPLHAWLPDAYPRATIFGTVFLAGFTTKAAVYILARAFPGEVILVWVGATMTIYGVYFAFLENNIRRLLSYHIMSQVGYMVCGIGLGSPLAVNGACAHAMTNIYYKGLLLMGAGAVIHATGRERLSDLGQLIRPMKWTFLLMMVGALSIAGMPLFNGFVSKSMITTAAGDAKQGTVYFLLYLASMGTFLSIALKLVYFTFLGPDHGATVNRPVPRSMYASMGIVAALCIFTGLPGGYRLIYDNLPTPAIAESLVHFQPYTVGNILETLQLLIGTSLAFWVFRHRLVPKRTITLDVDRLYRGPLALGVGFIGSTFVAIGRHTEELTSRIVAIVWNGVSSYGDLRRRAILAKQLVVIVFTLAAVAYIAVFLAR